MFNFLRVGSRSLEERIFINVLFISFIAVLLFTVNAVVVLKDLPIIITDAVAAIAIGVLFYLTRFKRLYKKMIIPYSLVILCTINAVWFISGGYDSPNGYILIAILIIIVVVSKHKHAQLAIFLILTNVISLFAIEYFYPDIVIEYPKREDIVSQAIVFTAVLIAINYIILQLKESYDEERKTVSMINDKLKRKNEEIQSQNLIISSQNKQLKNYSDALEEKVRDGSEELSVLYEDLKTQNQTLEQFTFITAHNLRSPIANIKGLINLLDKDLPDNSVSRETYQHLCESANQLDTVVSDIASILHVKMRGKKLEVVNLSVEIQNTLSTLGDMFTDKGASYTIECDETLQIAGTKAYVQSILFNLIHNSLKYSSSERNPEILISGKTKSDGVHLMIKDNGIGIDMNVASEKIFQLYQRFKTEYEGKGYGLFLVKTQVEAMKGKVAIESQLDKGTTTTIIFPPLNSTALKSNQKQGVDVEKQLD